MKPDGAIEMLIREHRIILQVIEGLGGLARHLREGRNVDVAQLREAVAFMREFADDCHHAKEKDLLYPACIDYGLQLHGHPIAALLEERQESRQLEGQLADSTREYAAHRAGAGALIATTIAAIAKLYSRHIRDEEKMVFPMVKLVLPAETRNRLYAQFEGVDERNPPGIHKRFHEFAKQLLATAGQ
jgi:hemerythrin-like domain-containing protein